MVLIFLVFFLVQSGYYYLPLWEDLTSADREEAVAYVQQTSPHMYSYYNGTLTLSNDDGTFSLLEELMPRDGSNKVNALKAELFFSVVSKSDGALAEAVGFFCLTFLKSAPLITFEYLDRHPAMMEHAAHYIAWELFFSESVLQEFVDETSEYMSDYSQLQTCVGMFLERVKSIYQAAE